MGRGPSTPNERRAIAVLIIFSQQRKKTPSTQSAAKPSFAATKHQSRRSDRPRSLRYFLRSKEGSCRQGASAIGFFGIEPHRLGLRRRDRACRRRLSTRAALPTIRGDPRSSTEVAHPREVRFKRRLSSKMSIENGPWPYAWHKAFAVSFRRKSTSIGIHRNVHSERIVNRESAKSR